jgi:hypothetical protein
MVSKGERQLYQSYEDILFMMIDVAYDASIFLYETKLSTSAIQLAKPHL